MREKSMHFCESSLVRACVFAIVFWTGFGLSLGFGQSGLELQPGEKICYIGNTTADRMQHHGWLETYITALHPQHNLTFRNLGFSADEISTRPRSQNFGSPDQWLTKCEADVVFCFFGYNEALRGEANLPDFEDQLSKLIDQMSSQKYNGKKPPRLVFFSPLAHENLNSPHLPDGVENNRLLKIYRDAMQKVCESKDVMFFDLFHLSLGLYQSNQSQLTMNGIHLLDSGNEKLARALVPKLFPNRSLPKMESVSKLRDAILEKNYYWFSRYRVVDGYNVYGGRSKLAWFDQSNADVMKREMEIFDIMTGNRDQQIWEIAKGNDAVVKDDNVPEELIVKPNKEGPLAGGAWPYLGAEEAIDKMTIHENMKVNVFASEEMFPRLINPVQMSVDPDSRLFVACWESYPHWNPTQPRKDCICILPDEDGDGVADECKIFADGLNSVTGFEFWGGGMLVAAPPEIWFLKDTDGDDVADYKLRMLQGVSSADTHHSANALLIGPDGWLYFSRGIFNVANFETPTQTFRSGRSGIHRFNPRTFEFEFHFPIGPNPHGDVFDRWGYQFANDGTSGTGSYVNIGKGIGNKQWFQKRVRPVPANGILSSSHFPAENDGNFLISNAIGFLGVLQHKVSYNGADITATEIDPILYSDDPNFRPSDMEIGGVGALYIADWHNALIGHMQHNMRDPNRDHTHGRVYRVTYEGRPLVKPAKMRNRPIAEVCQHFFARENNTRYRARLELSGRDSNEVSAELTKFTEGLDPKKSLVDRDEAQALLECLWVFEEHRIPNLDLIRKVFQADEPKVRAAAIRTLGHWAGKIENWQDILISAAGDPNALVRAEAVKSAVNFQETAAAEAIFIANTMSLDPEMESVLKFAKSKLDIDSMVKQMLASGDPLSPAARRYVLATAAAKDLIKLPPSEDVFRAILTRQDVSPNQMQTALNGLAEMTNQSVTQILIESILKEQEKPNGNQIRLGQALAEQPADDLRKIQTEIEQLAINGSSSEIKRLGYASWVAAVGPDDAYLAASQSKQRLKDFLDAVPTVRPKARAALFDKVMPLIFELPTGMESESAAGQIEPGVLVKYGQPHPANATNEVIDAKPNSNVIQASDFRITIPDGRSRDQFYNVFQSAIDIPETGKYRFYLASDDGSRLYIDRKELINNDGDHGMVEKSGAIELSAGLHPIRVNYFDSGGGDGLKVSWQGPGIEKQPVPAGQLFIAGKETIHETAIRALAAIPGNDKKKFEALCQLISSGRLIESAINALARIPSSQWNSSFVKPLANNLVGYLSSLPPRLRTTDSANRAVELTKNLASTLGGDEAQDIRRRLSNLDVRVIAIGTVSHRMIYDKEQIVVEAGKPIEFRFSNTDSMPHNFAVVAPGSLEEVGELGESTGR
ncbi:MAG: PVC-type heme-binding CxxCH protein, partial [Planctomycetota bacterium]